MGMWIKASGIAIACGVLFAELSRAGYVPPAPIPEIAEEISFQSLLTDMALPSISPNPHNSPATLSYQGSFSQGVPTTQDGWAGTFSGTYLGSSVTGSMSAQTVGDPDWKLTGTITQGSMSVKLAGTLVQDPKDPTKFNLENTTFGNYKWSSPDQLTETFQGNQSVLTGTIDQSDGVITVSYKARFAVDVNNGKVTSTFEQISPKVNNPVKWSDGGKAKYQVINDGNGFLGTMNDQVATVPEPATATLLGAGTLTLLGYGWRRRKQIS